jgi:hypothetical protein
MPHAPGSGKPSGTVRRAGFPLNGMGYVKSPLPGTWLISSRMPSGSSNSIE